MAAREPNNFLPKGRFLRYKVVASIGGLLSTFGRKLGPQTSYAYARDKHLEVSRRVPQSVRGQS